MNTIKLLLLMSAWALPLFAASPAPRHESKRPLGAAAAAAAAPKHTLSTAAAAAPKRDLSAAEAAAAPKKATHPEAPLISEEVLYVKILNEKILDIQSISSARKRITRIIDNEKDPARKNLLIQRLTCLDESAAQKICNAAIKNFETANLPFNNFALIKEDNYSEFKAIIKLLDEAVRLIQAPFIDPYIKSAQGIETLAIFNELVGNAISNINTILNTIANYEASAKEQTEKNRLHSMRESMLSMWHSHPIHTLHKNLLEFSDNAPVVTPRSSTPTDKAASKSKLKRKLEFESVGPHCSRYIDSSQIWSLKERFDEITALAQTDFEYIRHSAEVRRIAKQRLKPMHILFYEIEIYDMPLCNTLLNIIKNAQELLKQDLPKALTVETFQNALNYFMMHKDSIWQEISDQFSNVTSFIDDVRLQRIKLKRINLADGSQDFKKIRGTLKRRILKIYEYAKIIDKNCNARLRVISDPKIKDCKQKSLEALHQKCKDVTESFNESFKESFKMKNFTPTKALVIELLYSTEQMLIEINNWCYGQTAAAQTPSPSSSAVSQAAARAAAPAVSASISPAAPPSAPDTQAAKPSEIGSLIRTFGSYTHLEKPKSVSTIKEHIDDVLAKSTTLLSLIQDYLPLINMEKLIFIQTMGDLEAMKKLCLTDPSESNFQRAWDLTYDLSQASLDMCGAVIKILDR